MRLRILRMGPLEAEVRALLEIGATFLAGLVIGVGEGEVAVELVVHLVPGIDVDGIGSQGIVAAGQGQVEIVSQDEVHARVSDEKAAGDLLTESRHQQAGGARGLGRDEAEWQADGEGNVGNHGIGRAEDGFLGGLGDHLRHRHPHIIMRMFQVAHGVHAVPEVDGLVRHHFNLLALQETFRLLGDHVRDAGLLGVEIIVELLHLVR